MKKKKKNIVFLLLLIMLLLFLYKTKTTNSMSKEKVVVTKPIIESVVSELPTDNILDINSVNNTDDDEKNIDENVHSNSESNYIKLSSDVSLNGIVSSSGMLLFDDKCDYYKMTVYEDSISFNVFVHDEKTVVTGNGLTQLVVGSNNVVIHLVAEDGTKRDIVIEVIRLEKIDSIICDEVLFIDLNEEVNLSYEINPMVNNPLIDFKSSNQDIVEVSNSGTIKAINYGNSTISICSVEFPDVCANTLIRVTQKELISSIYKVDRDNGLVISSISDMHKDDFFNNFDNDNDLLNVDLEGDAKVGTGGVIKLVINNIEYDSLKICILGDLDGDGVVSPMDSDIMRKMLLEIETFDDYVYIAADLDKDGIIGMVDDALMKKYINGEIDSFN